MPVKLSDQDIDKLIAEKKPLPAGLQSAATLRPKRGHREREFDLVGAGGSQFRLILRQSVFNVLDFSVILAYRPPNSNELFRLRRYNGRSHEHTNPIEQQIFYDFHVHYATERYQALGGKEDSYAVPTDRYGDVSKAIGCMLADCGFDVPPQLQGQLL